MIEGEPMVLVVDDDPLVRRSTERAIASAGYRVVSFPSAREFLEFPRPKSPACLILDLRMPGLGGLEVQQQLHRSGVKIPIIFVTGHGDIPTSVQAIKAGAVEFLTKPYRRRILLAAIQSAIERDRMDQRESSETADLRSRHEQLTAREREVMLLLAQGLPGKLVASELATTERMIKFHRANIMQKMRADSLASLVRMSDKLKLSASG
jgi:FixJ family two-component response regulator